MIRNSAKGFVAFKVHASGKVGAQTVVDCFGQVKRSSPADSWSDFDHLPLRSFVGWLLEDLIQVRLKFFAHVVVEGWVERAVLPRHPHACSGKLHAGGVYRTEDKLCVRR
jgi:hypothetical protein